MGQHLKVPAAFLICGALLMNTGCLLKQPGDPDNFGAPTTADAINAAIDVALDVDQSKVFHVGDMGVSQIVNDVLGSSAVVLTFQETVTAINTKQILWSRFIVETNTTQNFAIDIKSSPTTTAKTWKKIKRFIASAKMLLNKIQIQASTAVGAELPPMRSESHKVNMGLLKPMNFSQAAPKVRSKSVGDCFSADNVGSTDSYTSKYYGLTVIQHQYVTQNCSQLPNCKANSTRIEFNEIRSCASGETLNLRQHFEISKDVPGLFSVLESCKSAVLVDGDNQTPLTQCTKVQNFTFGSPN